MRYRMLLLLCFLSLGCTLSAQEPEREIAKEARIFKLPEFERAFLCVRYFEGWHSEKNHPYVGWGHCLQPGEKYSARTMTRQRLTNCCGKTFGSSAPCSGIWERIRCYYPKFRITKVIQTKILSQLDFLLY